MIDSRVSRCTFPNRLSPFRSKEQKPDWTQGMELTPEAMKYSGCYAKLSKTDAPMMKGDRARNASGRLRSVRSDQKIENNPTLLQRTPELLDAFPFATVGQVEAFFGRSLSQIAKMTMADRLAYVVNATLLDVRTEGEFNKRHIPSSINIPIDTLEQRIKEIDPAAPIVVYCRSGCRSNAAMSMLKQTGCNRLLDMQSFCNWSLLSEDCKLIKGC